MENKDKELTVPKWVLINQPKVPKVYTPQLSVLAQKFGILMKKRLYWASVVRDKSNSVQRIIQMPTICSATRTQKGTERIQGRAAPKIRQSIIYYAGLLGHWDKQLVNQAFDVQSIIFDREGLTKRSQESLCPGGLLLLLLLFF